jgi:pimeloyl-ACP methyl ester carboxylesterase
MIFLSAVLVLAGMMAGCNGTRPDSGSGQTIPLEPCHLSAPGSTERLSAQCGSLTVFENHDAQSGRQIELHIAMIPAISRTPEPDPILYITGGPGGASTQDFVATSSAFDRMNEKRDILLVDQRGTGQSHPLECADPEEELDFENETLLRAEIKKCIDQIDADPRFYNTRAAVQDLDLVRAAMGYEKLNIYGVSYGSRVAQTYLRTYPQHVRTVILDGVLPQDEALGVSVASDAQKTLDAVFARCAADADCNEAFPDLPDALAVLMARVAKEPVMVELQHPYTSKATEVEFTQSKLGMAIRLLSYGSETAALLPLLIHDAHKTGDLSRLAAQWMIVYEQLQGSVNAALNHSVVCAEDVPFLRQEGKFIGNAQAEKSSYLGEYYRQMEKICQYWPAAEASPAFKEPVQSEIPVLLLSGEFDPVTPANNADHVAEGLSNSLHLVAPGQGHGVIFRGCAYKIATEFVERGTVDGLDADCIQDLKPDPFFLSFTGPRP